MINNLKTEASFFHSIAQRVIGLVQSRGKEMTVATSKGVGDYATKVDIDVENLIVSELRKLFPDDQILAEEGYSGTAITDGRMWLIDPICGTSNLGKGINNFCTNIALVNTNQVIAALCH